MSQIRRPRSPEADNDDQPLHGVLKRADTEYVHSHALVSHEPHVGQLPATLDVDWEFLGTVSSLVNPPANAWRDLDGHLDRHYSQHERFYTAVYEAVVNNLNVVHDELQAFEPDPEEEFRRFKGYLARLRARFAEDPVIAYEEFPHTLLVYYELLRLLNLYVSDPVVTDELARFAFLLTYPTDPRYRDQYNLNVRYHRPVNVGGTYAREFHLLCGYTLGKSEHYWDGCRWREAVWLTGPAITTVHAGLDHAPNSALRPGLVCELNIMDPPELPDEA
ncbi:hypothetical protein DAERI_020176 [Deinococcus aerius]|uniref:Uncharacterized protein n=1 Tax=Deinococcus aerius TaxID=200253 RepID=A0A2I9CSG4_9DEIO|nr:hypothetical protein [Deinococcus aerius]GBF04579.1 hypothetical protein DAERI_020176 [Deinococcus aerius]